MIEISAADDPAADSLPAPDTDRPQGPHARGTSAGTEAGALISTAQAAGPESEVNDNPGPAAPPFPNAASPSTWQHDIANHRRDVLTRHDRIKAAALARGETMSLNQIADELGMSAGRLHAWLKLWLPTDGRPQRDYNALLPPASRGRPSDLEKLGLSAEQLAEIKAVLQGLNLDTDSDIAALRAYAQSDRCPEPFAELVLRPRRSRHSVPKAVRALARVDANQKKAHRGPRTLALKGLWIPRRNDILPGDIFSSDDTTAIWGAWVPWVTNEDYPFGVKLLQVQHLPVIDVASQAVITYALIAREKSSYRASDIWALFGHTFEIAGLPRLGWQLERGSWEASLIAGEECEYDEGDASHRSATRRAGGLRQLPSQITSWHREKLGDAAAMFPSTLQTWTSYLPKSKSVEAFINRSQTFEGTLWGSLGRSQMRAPFEKAKKLFQHCARPRAKEDPRHHFLSLTEIAARLNKLYTYLNHEPMEGEVFKGVPWLNLTNALADHPLHRLPEERRWLYRRDWRSTHVQQGFVRVRLTHPISGERFSHFYTHPRVFAEMEGRPVLCYYDREDYQQPAQIIDARTGEHVCEADYFERVGSFLDGERTGHEVCKAWKNAVMTIYSSLLPHIPSRQLPPEVAARREASKAAAASVQVDGRPAAVAAAPPPQFGSLKATSEPQRRGFREQAAIAARLLNHAGD